MNNFVLICGFGGDHYVSSGFGDPSATPSTNLMVVTFGFGGPNFVTNGYGTTSSNPTFSSSSTFHFDIGMAFQSAFGSSISTVV